MCGIVGAALNMEGPARLDDAIKRLHHRGPDDSGFWNERGTHLGFARLAIIDLTDSGHQPMTSPDGRYVIVFNGEIYNFPELRAQLEAVGEIFRGHSDTEVLLRIFLREGLERCLEKLRGMFAFAVWDRQERSLSLARDRLGVKPLVYAETPNGFLFASEIQALFALDPGLSRDPDISGIDHYLTFQYIPAPMSGFAAIRKLPPAHAIVVKNGRIDRLFRYWDVDLTRRSALSFDAACDALREQLLEATRLRLVSDVPLGAFLSGGVDSGITVAAMARLGASPLRTFSIGFEDERFNELPQAREVAKHLGTEHHEMTVKPDAVSIMPMMIDHLGEPLADNSVIPTYYVSQFARTGVTVALTGDGGDEVFAGYRRFYQIRRQEWLARRGLLPLWRYLRRLTVILEDNVRLKRRRRQAGSIRSDQMLVLKGLAGYKHLLSFYSDSEKLGMLTPELHARIGTSTTTDYLSKRFERPGEDVLNRYLYLDLTTYLPEDILFKVDIASMANSLECRSPFLDHKLIEFAASLPGRYKLSVKGRHKHILKSAFADWLPRGFMDRPKKGFSVPLARWLREELADTVRETLISRKTLSHWFQQKEVERLVGEHMSGRISHSTRLWPLLVLSLWAERFKVPV
jgi:asparagine synthase (glutamine-hydrolysing)